MDRRSKIIVSVVGIFIVLLALVGITYAYFLTQIQGNTNDTSISITTANLRLVYSDGQNIEAENIQPGDTIYTKTFTVKNEGNASIDYEVYLENVINNFVHEEDLLMFVTCSSNITGNTCNGYGNGSVSGNTPTFGTSIYPQTNSLLIQNSIEPASTGVNAEVHTYTLFLKFKDDNSDQSIDMGKTLQGKIQIYDPKDVVGITGTVTGYDSTYYLELHSDTKTSEIASDGSYIFYGVGAEEHTLYVMKRNHDGTTSEIGSKIIDVTKGNEASVNSDASSIVITDNVDKATVNVTIPASKNSITLTGINIIKGELSAFEDGTLASIILINGANVTVDGVTKKVKTIKNNPNFETIADGSSWDENLQDFINDGLFEADDDYTKTTGNPSYYFRGPITNNYLTIGTTCWRIVRIEGDGSVKLISEDQDEACSETMNSNWEVEGAYPNFGYTNITNDLHNINYLNLDGKAINYEGSIATYLKNYQTKNLASLTKILKAGNWCLNDRAYASASVDITTTNPLTENQKKALQDSGDHYYYDSYVRLYGNNTITPTLKCNGTLMDKFDSNTGMYVGTLTADEFVYAGGKVLQSNTNFYLSNDHSKNNYLSFWSLSPSEFKDSEDYIFIIYINSLENWGDVDRDFDNIRPAISLKPSVEYLSGDGTIESPYTIKIED